MQAFYPVCLFVFAVTLLICFFENEARKAKEQRLKNARKIVAFGRLLFRATLDAGRTDDPGNVLTGMGLAIAKFFAFSGAFVVIYGQRDKIFDICGYRIFGEGKDLVILTIAGEWMTVRSGKCEPLVPDKAMVLRCLEIVAEGMRDDYSQALELLAREDQMSEVLLSVMPFSPNSPN